jgi:hypothetical protein
MPPRSLDLEAALAKAAERVNECDGIVIIMQKKAPTGGFLYYHNEDMKLETVVWYLTSVFSHIHLMAAGIKPDVL